MNFIVEAEVPVKTEFQNSIALAALSLQVQTWDLQPQKSSRKLYNMVKYNLEKPLKI